MKTHYLLTMSAVVMMAMNTVQADIKLDDQCNVDHHYEISMKKEALLFTTDAGDVIRIDNGQLLYNGDEVALSRSERGELKHYEQVYRDMAPVVRDIAMEAAEVASIALQQVVTAFNEIDPEVSQRMASRLDKAIETLRFRLESQPEESWFDERAIEEWVQEIVMELAPSLAGEAVNLAIKAAFSGDQEMAERIEKRMEDMDQKVEALVAEQGKRLESHVKTLCDQMHDANEMEQAMALNLPDGTEFDALTVSNQ